MPKMKPVAERRTESVIAFISRGTRERVEQIAHRERVSLSEVARRAIETYVESPRFNSSVSGR